MFIWVAQQGIHCLHQGILHRTIGTSTTKQYSSTILYYKLLLQHYSVLHSTTPVLLCTTKYYSSTTLYYKVLPQYYSVLHSTTPVLLRTTKYYSSTTLYYKVLLQYYSVLQSTTPVLLQSTSHPRSSQYCTHASFLTFGGSENSIDFQGSSPCPEPPRIEPRSIAILITFPSSKPWQRRELSSAGVWGSPLGSGRKMNPYQQLPGLLKVRIFAPVLLLVLQSPHLQGAEHQRHQRHQMLCLPRKMALMIFRISCRNESGLVVPCDYCLSGCGCLHTSLFGCLCQPRD